MLTIYHNPRCSKSREALAMVAAHAETRGTTVEVVEYLKTPLTHNQLRHLRELLGGSVATMMRSTEDEYTTLKLAQADDDALLDALAAHPKLLQRPIVVDGERAIVARPPEVLREFLG